jgi:hypothetical protein
MDIKIKRKLGNMNKNMFNYLKEQGIKSTLTVTNKEELDSDNSSEFVPVYELIGTGKTNKSFKFKVLIDPEKEFEVIIVLNDLTKFKLENNSQLKFAVNNYLVPDKK